VFGWFWGFFSLSKLSVGSPKAGAFLFPKRIFVIDPPTGFKNFFSGNPKHRLGSLRRGIPFFSGSPLFFFQKELSLVWATLLLGRGPFLPPSPWGVILGFWLPFSWACAVGDSHPLVGLFFSCQGGNVFPFSLRPPFFLFLISLAGSWENLAEVCNRTPPIFFFAAFFLG